MENPVRQAANPGHTICLIQCVTSFTIAKSDNIREDESIMDAQLFTFLFAFVVFGCGVLLMYSAATPGRKRIEELDTHVSNK